jgi:hypothetical protein
MKRILVFALLIGVLIASLSLMAGCGGSKTVQTPEGSVTTQDNGNSGTVTTPDGSTTYSDQAPTEEQLGAPIYPGANYVEGSGGYASGTSSTGQYSAASGEFTTSDDFDTVLAWYTGKLGAPVYTGTASDSDSSQEAIWVSTSSGHAVSVTLDQKSDATHITIGSYGGD